VSAEIQSNIDGAEVALVRSSGGVFDVHLGEELIFSKRRQGRFPDPGEITALLGG
jgi:selT/selW/selH-like putative selenoprotein